MRGLGERCPRWRSTRCFSIPLAYQTDEHWSTQQNRPRWHPDSQVTKPLGRNASWPVVRRAAKAIRETALPSRRQHGVQGRDRKIEKCGHWTAVRLESHKAQHHGKADTPQNADRDSSCCHGASRAPNGFELTGAGLPPGCLDDKKAAGVRCSEVLGEALTE